MMRLAAESTQIRSSIAVHAVHDQETLLLCRWRVNEKRAEIYAKPICTRGGSHLPAKGLVAFRNERDAPLVVLTSGIKPQKLAGSCLAYICVQFCEIP